jgi:thiamine pyrophosphate-dependent acetolactate synthase large subunit-like protein
MPLRRGARVIQLDIDPHPIGRKRAADGVLAGDCAPVLAALLAQLRDSGTPPDPARLAPWWQRIGLWRAQRCLDFDDSTDSIVPQALMCAAGCGAARARRDREHRCGPAPDVGGPAPVVRRSRGAG